MKKLFAVLLLMLGLTVLGVSRSMADRYDDGQPCSTGTTDNDDGTVTICAWGAGVCNCQTLG